MAISFKPGFYKAKITRWGIGKTSTGKPQFVITFLPSGLKVGGKLETCPQFERSVFRVITENTIDFVVQDLAHLGYGYDTFDQLDPNHPEAFDFEGLEIEVRCEHEKYEGKDKERWNLAMSGGGPDVKPLERREVSELNAMFGGKLKSNKPKAPAPTTTQGPTRPAARTALEREAEEVF